MTGVQTCALPISGLPGEDIESFSRGFDRLYALGQHEIQFGILKRLRGTPIIRHTEAFRMAFDAYPPYSILATDRIGFATMQRLVRFSRYWDLIANSGRFSRTLPLILRDAPFANFMALADWLYANTDATHRIALDRLARLVGEWLGEQGIDAEAALGSDYAGQAGKFRPNQEKAVDKAGIGKGSARQERHLAG